MSAKIARVVLLGLALGAADAAADSVLRFRLYAEPKQLDTAHKRTAAEGLVLDNVLEGLVRADDEYRMQPAMATHWEISEGGKKVTFHLRFGARWSDGKQVSSRDFAEAWRRVLDPRTGSEFAAVFFPIENAESYHRGKLRDFSKVGIATPDFRTLELRLKQPGVPLLPMLLHKAALPVRPDLVKKKRWSRVGPGFVSNGPYRIREVRASRFVVLERNPKYLGVASPTIDRVVGVIEPDERRALSLLGQRQVDLHFQSAPADVGVAVAHAEIPWRSEAFSRLGTVFLGFNLAAKEPLSADARRALAMAIDREALLAQLDVPFEPARALTPRELSDEGLEGPGFDPARASELFKATALGRRKLRLVYMRGVHERAAGFLVKALAAAGATVIEVPVAPERYAAAVRDPANPLRLESWYADAPEPASFMKLFETGSALNRSGYSNSAVDEALAKARAESDAAKQAGLLAPAERALLESAALVPLFHPKMLVHYSQHVKMLGINPRTGVVSFARMVLRGPGDPASNE